MLVECVPNFSEGRRRDVVDAIAQAALGVRGVGLLDVHMDPDHNRSVLTLAGPPAAVAEAAFRAVAEAVKRIDVSAHDGVHPRIGAADVVPFIPLEGAPLELAVDLARSTGERLADELSLPVFFYEEAARRPERRDLAHVRNLGFKELARTIESDDARVPDVGPRRVHPTAGAVAVGARFFLVAWNVDLATQDLSIAKSIAKAVRASSGGLPAVKALGFPLPQKQRVQVSMNLVDYRKTGIGKVTREVERLAREKGVAVHSCELVGLAPRRAVVEAAAELVNLEGPPLVERLLETRLEGVLPPSPAGPIEPYLDAIASTSPAPGGGSAAALSLALAQACAAKALAFTKPPLEATLPDRAEVIELAARDERAFADWMRARGLPKGDPARGDAIAAATRAAIDVGVRALEAAVSIAETAASAATTGNPNLLNDAALAAELALAAARGARWNVLANASKDTTARTRTDALLARIEEAAARARGAADAKHGARA